MNGVPRNIRKRWPPKLARVVEQAIALGCTLEKSGRSEHIVVFTPSGKRLTTIACIPSDHRTHLNDASDLRRKLLELQQ